MSSIVSPSREDGVVRAASEVVGGPAGSHLRRGQPGFWSAAPILVVGATAMMVAATLARGHCRATLWASPDQFTHACYSDIATVSASASYVSQPVGTGGLLWLLALLSPDGAAQVRWVFDLSVLLVTVALLALVVAVVRLSGRRPWDAALVALSPVLVTASLVSLDLVAVSLAVWGLVAFSRRRPGLAGALLGLAVVVRPIALLVLVALALLAVRSGRLRGVARAWGAAAVAWVVLNAPVLVVNAEGWRAYWSSLWHQPVGYGSLWILPQLAGHPVVPGVAHWGSLVGIALAVLAVSLFVLGVRYRPRLPAVVLALVVGVLVASPAVPVQASLWVLPFAALAVPRWRDLLIWAGVEVVFGTVTWLYIYSLSEASRGAPPWLYGALVVLRLAAMLWLVRQAVLASVQPWRDPVRSPRDAPGLGRDDPCAGEIEDAADASVVHLR